MYKYSWKWNQRKKRDGIRAWLRKYGFYALFIAPAFVILLELNIMSGLDNKIASVANRAIITTMDCSPIASNIASFTMDNGEIIKCK